MKGVIKGLIAGLIIIIIGVGVLLIGLALNGWKIQTEFETKTYTAENEVNSFYITVNAGKLKTEFYDGDYVTIEYPYAEKYNSEISEANGALYYTSMKLKWYNFASWGYFNILPATIIKIPQSVVNLDVTLNAGTVDIAQGTYGDVKIDINAGTLNTSSVICSSFDCRISAGSANVHGITCAEKLQCEVSAGTLNVSQIICKEISVDVSAGTTCLTIDDAREKYTIRAERSAGSITGASNQTGTDPEKKLTVNVSAGSVSVSFSDRAE